MVEKRFGNWREWIHERFGDKDIFQIEIDEYDVEYIIRSVNPKIKTQITFHFMRPDDNETLYDIHFGGTDAVKNNIWLSHFSTDPEFKAKSRRLATSIFMTGNFIDRLENEWLYIPLREGWTEKIYYIGKKIYRAKLCVGGIKTEVWDMDVKVPFELNVFDYLKIFLSLGMRIEQFTFEPME